MPTSLAQKLQIKPGKKLLIRNVPNTYLKILQGKLKGIDVVEKSKDPVDALLIFVNDLSEVKRLVPKSINFVIEDGLFWIAYPKGTSKIKTDVNRDRLWEAVEPMNLRPVRLISLDDTWSAMRFRFADKVGTTKK